MNRLSGKQRLMALAVAVATVAMFSAGRVAATGDSGKPDQGARNHGDEGPPTPAQVWKDLGPEQQAILSPEQQAGMDALSDAAAADRVAVGDADGAIAGFITADALNDVVVPDSEKDLYPVRDEAGTVVAYWGGPHGVISKDAVDAPGEADLDQILKDRGVTLG